MSNYININQKLVSAIGCHSSEDVNNILDSGADINFGYGYPLQLAAKNGDIEIVNLLISRGANVHIENEAALRIAAKYKHNDVVKALFSASANIHADYDHATWLSEHHEFELVREVMLNSVNEQCQA